MIISAHSPSWPSKYKLKICAKYSLCPFFRLSSAFHEAKIRMASRLNTTVSLINQDKQHNTDFQQKTTEFSILHCCLFACLIIAFREFHSYTFKGLSSSIFQSLSVSPSGMRYTLPDLHFVQYIKHKCPLMTQYHQLPTAAT